MKTLKTFWLGIFAFACIFASCKKEKTDEEQLPPITQTGANTFGCLINGKLFIPQGFEQNKPNFSLTVDPTFQNGNFGIAVFNKVQEIRFDFGSNDLKDVGTYFLEDFTKSLVAQVSLDKTNCFFGPSSQCIIQGPCYVKGKLQITRYDLTNRIFSGIFDFKLFDPSTGCDTFYITQGRFDKKL